jgi:predicted amidophosphoribosyltransferase
MHAHAPQSMLLYDLLTRTHYTAPQTSLPFHARQRNVQDAFRLHPRYSKKIMGKKILIIDDVLTTGATVNACAHILKEAGAAKIYISTLTKRLRNENWSEELE